MNVIGKVVNINNQGAVIEIEPGIEGFLPNSQKGTREDEIELNLNQELELKIISINPSLKRIILSRKAFVKEKEEKELEKYLKQQIPPRVTLGEIISLKLGGGKGDNFDL
jgi:small subunit ribosomal protein S1